MTVKLLGINSTGPVRVRALGQRGKGLDWTCEPETFPRVIEMINQYGGPSFWSIEEL